MATIMVETMATIMVGTIVTMVDTTTTIINPKRQSARRNHNVALNLKNGSRLTFPGLIQCAGG